MASPAADSSVGVVAEQFGWPLARLACSVHRSFAWNGNAVDPRTCVPLERSWGERHRLSLLAQFSAHQSFLAFAGLQEESFDPTEWTVVKARGSDVRLVRVAARLANEWSGATPFDRVVTFASFLGVDDLAALQRPWGRADHVYAEARAQLAGGSAADLSGVSRAAFGALLSPGAESLDRMLDGPVDFPGADALIALRNLATLSRRSFITIGGAGANPLKRGSGLGSLMKLKPDLSVEDPEEAVETLLEMRNAIVAVEQSERLDPLSRNVVERLISEGRQIALRAQRAAVGEEIPLVDGRSRFFIVSSSAEAMRSLMSRLSEVGDDSLAHLGRFCESQSYEQFLSLGIVPVFCSTADPTATIGEPARSFLSALALLGRKIDLELASRFLAGIGALVTPLELVRAGVSSVTNGRFIFESDEVRRKLERHLSPEMIDSLAASALELLGTDAPLSRFGLALRRNDTGGALQVLSLALEEGVLDESAAAAALQTAPFRPEELRVHELLAVMRAENLMNSGAYRSALELVDELPAPRARLVAARACRRLGRYDDALEILEATELSFHSALLAGVLHRLKGDLDRAAVSFASAETGAADESDRIRLEFERSILAIDRGAKPKTVWKRKAQNLCPWLVARFDVYQSLARDQYGGAAEKAEEAIELSPGLAESIDAHVDLVFARFMAGEWGEASVAAREALQIIEETEGDRAGGGLLYTLAYLSADEGRWRESEALLRKLESFYEENRDERRKRELDLIRAQMALGRLDYTEARRAATRVESCDVSEIRYAAKLILDEVDWIEGSLPMPRVDGRTGCAELGRRAGLIRARAGETIEPALFFREILDLERQALDDVEVQLPSPSTASERLMLIRSLDGLQRRLGSSRFEEEITHLCEEAGIDRRVQNEPRSQRFLIALATSEMPPPEVPIAGVDWRFAVRNRLGAWRQYGSLPHCESNQLEVVAVDEDVVRIGDFGLLWLQGHIEWTEELREAVANLWRVKWEHQNLVRLNEQMASTVRDDVPASADGIIGESAALRDALRPLPFAGRSELAVTIEGDTGTGKELVARAIHRRSPRRARPFTPVNCGALPENLVESELFGHVRGAFTGADRDRVGLIEATDGGTLFLDEVGEMPLPAQAKLLRFLQEGEFRRVGETEIRTADVRIIAATNRNLEKDVDDGKFRQDLYYRIKGIEIPLPPLRRRGHDVVLLARKFLADARDAAKTGPNGFTEDVEALFLGYGWEGNVRDLQNVVSWAFSLAGDAPLITVDHLPQRVKNATARVSKRGTYYEELAQFRRHMIEQSLLEAGGNQSRAAQNLGMTRQALSYQIRELGIHVRKGR